MKALLALEDGFCLYGESFTGPIAAAGGETIFNTIMTGYQELITDPALAGQMLCMTWPLIGNYGINPDDMESGRVHLAALLVKECCKEPSNWRSTESLPDFLMRQGVPGVEGLDTRALALHLRQHGALRGAISTSLLDPEALAAAARALPAPEGRRHEGTASAAPWRWDAQAARSGRPAPVTLRPDGSYDWPLAQSGLPRVLVYDFGVRWNILRQLCALGLDPLVVPPSFTPEQARAAAPDAILISDGPGDPAAFGPETAALAKLADSYPTAGFGLGFLLLGRALGASTARLKPGRHGANQPVKNLQTGKVEISAQNHGFGLTSGAGLTATHVHLNDNATAGFRHPSKPIFGVQHHPETATGPGGSGFFEQFKALIAQKNW